jgi:hypothetical protein
MIVALGLAVMAGNLQAQQRLDSVRSASPGDATFPHLTSSALADASADWPQYANNPFTFPVPETVSKDQFFVVDLNGDGLMDFTYRSETKLYVFDHYGDLLWSANIDNPRADITAGSHDGTGHGAADVDGDGAVEIVALNRSNKIVIYDGATGAIERTITLPILGSRNKWVYIAVANLRGNGDRDVVLQTMDTSGTKRGVYINRNLLAWDLENNRELWRVRQDDDYTNGIYEGYWGVAHGSFQCADVDGDGRDEVIGANMVDDDGRLINLGYPTDWVNAKTDGSTDHFDDLCIGDIRPDLPGLEWILVEEENQGSSNFNTTLMTTSGIVWRKMTTLYTGDRREAQNVAVGNFDLGRQHCEVWNRSRFNGDTDSQHPWVFDAFGTQFAHYATGDVLPPGFNTHQNGNKVGIEWIWTIDWDGGARNYIAAKARFVTGNVGVFNALTGAAIWHTTQLSPKTYASIIYVADISGDSREEVIVNDTTGTIRVYWNSAVNPNPPTARKWTHPLYRRVKQNWNSYSPNGYIDNSQLVSPSITLNLPNGGEQWIAGSTQTIRWSSSSGISNVALQLSTDAGNNWSTIVASTPNDGSYSWTVTETISSQCLLRVMNAAGGSPSDVSDGFFTILAPPLPTLTLTAPNGGESWLAGSSKTIRWNSTGTLANVALEFSASGGAVWTLIEASTNNDGTYQWTVPNSISSACLVRVSDASKPNIADISDGTFSISLKSLTSFVPYSNNPVLSPGAAGSWDEHTRERAWVMYENGAYYLWYSGWKGAYDHSVSNLMKLGYATSSDGVNWTKYSGNPIYSQSWIEDPIVLKDGNTYYMYAEDEYTGNGNKVNIVLYTSTNRINWSRYGSVLQVTGNGWESDQVATPTVWKEGGVWYMLYEGIGGSVAGQIGLATSLDGKNWTRYSGNPVLTGPFGTSLPIAFDSIIKRNGDYYAYGHYQNSALDWLGGLFTSCDLTSWTPYASNPIVESSAVFVDNGADYLIYHTSGSNADPAYKLSIGSSTVDDGFAVTCLPPSLQVIDPNGGENWEAGSTHAITWTWQGSIPYVKLEYSTDSGANWTTIISSAANTGSYGWTIPNAPSSQALIRILDAADGDPVDVSDGVFVIVGPPPSPAISSFTPASGSVGTAVTITGANFTGATSVKFTGISATPITVDNDTQIRVTVPSGASTGPISVTTSAGTGTSANDFTVIITGTLTLYPTDDAYVRSSNPTSNYATSSTLRVKTTSSSTYYGYLKFNVTGLSGSIASAKLRLYVKDASPDGGGVYLVSNDYLGSATPWVQSGLNWNNAPAITGSPLSSLGAVTLNTWVEFPVIGAITGNGTYSFALKNNNSDIVYYGSLDSSTDPQLVIELGAAAPAPSIASFTPTSGLVGTAVTITGANFTGATSVKFNGTSATPITVVNDTQIRINVPTGATTGKVTVTTNGGTATSTNDFTVTLPPAPTITSFTPASGSVGTPVTISGANFTGATSVKFNGTSATPITLDNDTQIRVNVPSGATTGQISVTTSAGTETSANDFTVTLPPAPAITSFTPASGTVGTPVTITGTDFTGASSVKFNGTSAATFTVSSATQILANVPSGATTGKISVITAGGTGQSASDFTVSAPSQITFQETKTGGSTASTSVTTSASLTAASGDLYLAAIGTKPNVSVSSVSGLGLTWTLVKAQCAGRGQTRVEVWKAQGTPSVNGTVTASLASAPNNATIAVSRYAGVDAASPVGNIISGNTMGANGTCSGGTDNAAYSFNLTTTLGGAVAFGAVTMRDKPHTPGAGYTERAELMQGASGSVASVAVEDKSVASAGSVVVNGSFSASVDWAMVGLEIKPAGVSSKTVAETLEEEATMSAELPSRFQLAQNHPNPFNGQTTIEYSLPEPSHVRINIYNALGQLVRKLVDENEAAGIQRAIWDGKDNDRRSVGSGVYFYELHTGGRRFVGRMILQQ